MTNLSSGSRVLNLGLPVRQPVRGDEAGDQQRGGRRGAPAQEEHGPFLGRGKGGRRRRVCGSERRQRPLAMASSAARSAGAASCAVAPRRAASGSSGVRSGSVMASLGTRDAQEGGAERLPGAGQLRAHRGLGRPASAAIRSTACRRGTWRSGGRRSRRAVRPARPGRGRAASAVSSRSRGASSLPSSQRANRSRGGRPATRPAQPVVPPLLAEVERHLSPGDAAQPRPQRAARGIISAGRSGGREHGLLHHVGDVGEWGRRGARLGTRRGRRTRRTAPATRPGAPRGARRPDARP
jgi:hypothetical protein